MVYHVLNRRSMRLVLFRKDRDYEAFERILADGLGRRDAPGLLAWCLMPNHWHLVLLAKAGTNLSTWMQWVAVTHTHRWHQHYNRVGDGPLYQGRFKSFPVQNDGHLLPVMRYVEANAQRAKLVRAAQDWRWGSLWVRQRGASKQRQMLSQSFVDLPADWPLVVNEAQSPAEMDRIHTSIRRSSPLGDRQWTNRTVSRLGLEATVRPRGRPKSSGKGDGNSYKST